VYAGSSNVTVPSTASVAGGRTRAKWSAGEPATTGGTASDQRSADLDPTNGFTTGERTPSGTSAKSSRYDAGVRLPLQHG
jgi:hypothetical protein